MRLRWFVIGALSTAGFLAVAGVLYISVAGPFSTRIPPTAMEHVVARKMRSMAIPAGAKSAKNPVAPSDEVLSEARAHWADHCAGCHANNGSGEIDMAKNMYPPPPDMRLAATQTLSDGELFYLIKNGVRLTGMPGWGKTDTEDQDSWKLVHFIRHLPKLTFEEEQQMSKLNPKSPDELAEEAEEEKFLRGESNGETKSAHHHH